MNNHAKFKKIGNLSKTFITQFSSLNRCVNFKNLDEHAKIKRININGYQEGFYDLKTYIEFFCEKDLRDFLFLCPKDIRPDLSDITEVTNCNITNLYSCWISTEDKESIYKTLDTIQNFDPLDKELFDEVLINLDLKKILIEEVISLVEKNEFEKALVLAKKDGEDVLWHLGQYCENNFKHDLQKAINCYQAIPQTNINYAEANDKLFHLLLQFSTEGLNESEKLHQLKLKFIYFLNSGSKNQAITDQLFHELCGYQDLAPKVKDIKGDADTLIAIAEQTREFLLAKDDKSLKKENEEIKQFKDTKQLKLGFISTHKNATDNQTNNFAGLKKGFLK